MAHRLAGAGAIDTGSELRGNLRNSISGRLLALRAEDSTDISLLRIFSFLPTSIPRLQLTVLRQVKRPVLVACDTMNFWIESRRPELLELLTHVDLITLNDGEARQLTERDESAPCAAQMDHGSWAKACHHQERGTRRLSLFGDGRVFYAPAYPLESIFDPTGAGDSFAGGFIGYLARSGDLSDANMRRAVVYGSAMGSFAVERFSIERLLTVTKRDIDWRVHEFRQLVAFEEELAT